MKKIISAILSVAMAFTFAAAPTVSSSFPDFAVTASAEETVSLEKQMLPYHYSQLSDKQKPVYIALRKAALNHDDSITVKASLEKEDIVELIDIIFYEDSLAFNVKGVTYGVSSNKIIFNIKYSFKQESAEKMMKKMDKVAEKVISKFDEDTSTYEKILYIHDYIIDNTVYDESLNSSRSAYGAMVQGRAVCEGYARAFGYICSKAGIKTVNVVGKGTDSNGRTENHMWNKVYYNKKWYDIDLTWDDPVSIYTENSNYDYFMCGSKAFSKTHTPEGSSLIYPTSTKDTTKSYYVKKKLVAEDNSSGYKLLASQIIKNAKKGKTSATIKMSDSTSFEKFKTYLSSNDSEKIFDILEAVNEKYEAVYPYGIYGFVTDKDTLTVKIYFMIKDSSLSDYYVDVSSATADDIAFFKEAGVKTSSKKSA